MINRISIVTLRNIGRGLCLSLPLMFIKTESFTQTKDAPLATMIPFQTTDWAKVPVTEHRGQTGKAFWKTIEFGRLRVRLVEYSANYLADHWCDKGHLVYCIDGEMTTQLIDGKLFVLKKGMSYQVSNEASLHKSFTSTGVKLLIIDGSFLDEDLLSEKSAAPPGN